MLFNINEIYILKKIWEDLIKKSNSNIGISKDVFIQYTQLQGLIGEKLFLSFDNEKLDFISYESFIKNMEILFLGTIEEKIKLLFIGINKNNLINKKDLQTILNHIPHIVFIKDNLEEKLEYTNKNTFLENNDNLNFLLLRFRSIGNSFLLHSIIHIKLF
uniref:EF-hand domain-containing protein n=1 Tax=viral metagenome TaxID=1070528 RepID=A0A6C0AG64_9ZZZZ